MAHSRGVVGVVCLSLFLVCTSGTKVSLDEETHSWAMTVLDHDLSPAEHIRSSSCYTARLQLKQARSATIDLPATQTMMTMGQVPRFEIEDSLGIHDGSFNTEWESDISRYKLDGWYVPFCTNWTTVATVIVRGKYVAYGKYQVADTRVSVRVADVYTEDNVNILGTPTNYTGGVRDDFNFGYGFLFEYIPVASVSWFPMVTTDSTVVIESDNELNSFQEIQLDLVEAEEKSVCVDNPDKIGIRQAVDTGERIIFNTFAGVVEAHKNDSTGELQVDTLLAKCVPIIRTAQQYAFYNLSLQDRVIAFGDDALVYVSKGKGQKFEPLLDDDEESMLNAVGLTVVSIILSGITHITDHLQTIFLVDTTYVGDGRYRTVAFREHYDGSPGGAWSSLASLPGTVMTTPSNVTHPNLLSSKGVSGGSPLVLHNAAAGSAFGRDIFAWGNALLYSPNAGHSFYMLRYFGNDTIVGFARSSKEDFAFLTASQELWMGSIGSPITIRLKAWTQDSIKRQIFFDNVDELQVIELDTTSGVPGTPLQLSRYHFDTLSVTELGQLQTRANKLSCPYQAIYFNATHDPVYTRTNIVVPDVVPPRVYLDFGDSYSFHVTLVPADHLTVDDLHMSFQLQNRDHLDVKVDVSRSWQNNTVDYFVTVLDKQTVRDQSLAGWNLSPTELKMVVSGATSACDERRTWSPLTWSSAYSIVFFTGCPPGRYMTFDPERTFDQPDECETAVVVDGEIQQVPCYYYDYDFNPQFLIIDTVIASEQQYTGKFGFTVLAGGEMLPLEPFTEQEKLNFNTLTITPIWSWIDDSNTGVSWVCLSGSCGNRKPSEFPKSPEFFVHVQASTKGIEESTYCGLQADLILRLHGFEMDFGTTVAITMGVYGGLMFILVVSWCVRRQIQKRHMI